MDKPLKYYLIIAGVFVMVLGIAVYAVWDKTEKDNKTYSHLNGDDPLLKTAKQKAQATLDTLFKLYPQYPTKSYVKFFYKNPQGTEAHRWGVLKDLQRDHVSVILKDPSIGDNDVMVEKEKQFPIEEVEDWLVELDSNKVRGGFTTQVILMETPNMDAKTKAEQLKNFVDPLQ